MILQLLLGVAGGAGVPVQTCMNNELKKRLGSPIRATLFSSFLSLVLVTVYLLVRKNLTLPFELLSGEPAWIYCGGLFGMCFMIGNVLLFSRAGSAVGVVMPVCGQILMGLLIDHFGLFLSVRRSLTPIRILGGAMLLTGMTLVAVGKSQAMREGGTSGVGSAAMDPEKKKPAGGLLVWYLVGIGGGMCSACQTAVNGRAGKLLGSPFKGVCLSLIVSTTVLLVLSLLQTALKRGIADRASIEAEKRKGFRLWICLGGVFGGTFMLVNAYLVNVFGNGITLTLALLGSVCGSAVIDHFALLGAVRARLNVKRVLGLALLFAGAALIRLL